MTFSSCRLSSSPITVTVMEGGSGKINGSTVMASVRNISDVPCIYQQHVIHVQCDRRYKVHWSLLSWPTTSIRPDVSPTARIHKKCHNVYNYFSSSTNSLYKDQAQSSSIRWKTAMHSTCKYDIHRSLQCRTSNTILPIIPNL